MSESPGIWLTPQAFERLRTELHELEGDGRLRIQERIAEARSHGDIRENADYDAAKNEQGLMEARIRKLRHMLEHAEVREAEDSGIVEIGSVVTVIDDDEDEYDVFVAPAENRVPGMLLASPQSPLGESLLGKQPGDRATYEAPGGTFSLTVVAVRAYEG
jgi:transcription elongation factor GreA